MSTKKKGMLTTSGEWAKHLRKFHKRKFWKGERKEAKKIKNVVQNETVHPGEILKEFYLQSLKITKEQLSVVLEISVQDTKRLLEGELHLTNALALRLSRLLKTSRKYWINLQRYYDERTIKGPAMYVQNMNHIEPVLTLRTNPLKVLHLMKVAKLLELNAIQISAIAEIPQEVNKKTQMSSRISLDASEKVVKLELLYKMGISVFDNNKSSFKNWLKSPVPALDNQIPQNLLTTHLGIDIVRDELLRIEHGII